VVSDLDETMIGDDEATAAFTGWWQSAMVPAGGRLVYNTGSTRGQQARQEGCRTGQSGKPGGARCTDCARRRWGAAAAATMGYCALCNLGAGPGLRGAVPGELARHCAYSPAGCLAPQLPGSALAVGRALDLFENLLAERGHVMAEPDLLISSLGTKIYYKCARAGARKGARRWRTRPWVIQSMDGGNSGSGDSSATCDYTASWGWAAAFAAPVVVGQPGLRAAISSPQQGIGHMA
jgi:hypothetical protein